MLTFPVRRLASRHQKECLDSVEGAAHLVAGNFVGHHRQLLHVDLLELKKGEEVSIAGIGIFSVKQRAAPGPCRRLRRAGRREPSPRPS